MRLTRREALDVARRNTLTQSAAQSAQWINHARQGYPQNPPSAEWSFPNTEPLGDRAFPLAEFRAMLTPGTPSSKAGDALLTSLLGGSSEPAQRTLNAADHAWQAVRNLHGAAFNSTSPPPPNQGNDLWDALEDSATKAGFNAGQLQNLFHSIGFENKGNGANFLKGLAGVLPKDQAKAFQSLATLLEHTSDDTFKSLLKGDLDVGKLTDLIGTKEGAAGVLKMLGPFLPPEAQKFVGLAATAIQSDFSTQGMLGAAIAFLPPEYQQYASKAFDLFTKNPSDFVGALLGQILPPELRQLFGAIVAAGGLKELLSQLGISDTALWKQLTDPAAANAGGASDPAAAGSAGGKQPLAARVTDLRSCPGGAGNIKAGCASVKIDRQLAARVADATSCSGGPDDVIVMGELTVVVGHSLAARMWDPTAHGGMIKSGSPTVMIGKVYTGSYVPMGGAWGAPGSGSGGGSGGGGGGGGGEGEGKPSGEGCLEKGHEGAAAVIVQA